MTYDRDRTAEFVLALMYLDVHDEVRAWKGYPWDVLHALHKRGLISDPKSKAKSVVLTEEGLTRAATAFETLLTPPGLVPRRLCKAESGKAVSRLSRLQSALVAKLLAPICAPHPDPAVASKLRTVVGSTTTRSSSSKVGRHFARHATGKITTWPSFGS